MTAVDEIRAALRKHQPVIDFNYEEFNCSCGWKRPDSMGVHTVKDGTRSWPAHQRRVLLATLPPAGEIHAPGACVPADAERLAEALIPVTRGVWSTPTQRNPDRQSEQDRRWRLNTAAAILAALAKPQEANHA